MTNWIVTILYDDDTTVKSWIIKDQPYHNAFKEAQEQVETHYKFFHWTLTAA